MALFRKRKSDAEIEAELRYHLDQMIEANQRDGMTEQDATERAHAEFGSLTAETECCRDHRSWERLATWFADFRYAARRLGRSPGFTMLVAISLAAGIGAGSALFSLVNAAILRMIRVSDPQQLVWFDSGAHGRALSYPFYQEIRNDEHFEGVLCAFATVINISTAGMAERAEAELVSGNYFEVLGVQPHTGRLLSRQDETEPVAVVSHSFWQTHLQGDRAIVGRTVRINGSAWTIAGVTPPGFDGLDRAYRRAVFLPMGMKPQVTPGWNGLDKPLIAWLYILGRLRPGVDRVRFSAELNARFHSFQEAHLPGERRLSPAQRQLIRERRLRLEPLGNAVFESRVASHLTALCWMVALLLALMCANVAGLLLSRGIERRRELATRLSIGASRGRIVRQLLVEALLLAGAGGMAGLLTAAIVAPWLASRFPIAGSGSKLDVPLDFRVVAFAVTVSAAACILFGLMPALQATKLDLVSALKGSAGGRSTGRLRHALIAGQAALSLVLLGAAALFSVNLRSLLVRDTGFDRQHLVLAEMDPTLSGYSAAARLRLYQALDEKLRALTGSIFASASISNVAPMSPYHWTSLFLVEGREQERDRIVRAVVTGPGYFETMKIPLRRGRLPALTDDENAPHVAVISESLARREFGEENPIGRRFTADLRNPKETRYEIVGVVGDTDLSDPRTRAHRPCVYLPYRQWPFTLQGIVLQARPAPGQTTASVTETLRRVLRELDPGLSFYDIQTIEQATASLLAGERLASLVTGFFGAAATLLCALGIFGVVSREFAVRTKEAAIRVALGARLATVIWLFARKPVCFIVAGLAAGAVFLAAIAPALRSLLTVVQPTDPRAIGCALVLLVVISALAVVLPVTRMKRLEPAALLRQE